MNFRKITIKLMPERDDLDTEHLKNVLKECHGSARKKWKMHDRRTVTSANKLNVLKCSHFSVQIRLLVWKYQTATDLKLIWCDFKHKSLKKQENSFRRIELQKKLSVDTSSRNEVWSVLRWKSISERDSYMWEPPFHPSPWLGIRFKASNPWRKSISDHIQLRPESGGAHVVLNKTMV
jgi:hypothetical protein